MFFSLSFASLSSLKGDLRRIEATPGRTEGLGAWGSCLCVLLVH